MSLHGKYLRVAYSRTSSFLALPVTNVTFGLLLLLLLVVVVITMPTVPARLLAPHVLERLAMERQEDEGQWRRKAEEAENDETQRIDTMRLLVVRPERAPRIKRPS